MKTRLSRAVRAFTLLEMLLAIAIAGLLITASSYLVISLSTIWALRTDEDSFDEHADGVTAFLQKAMNESFSRHQPTWAAQEDSDTETDTAAEKIASAASASSSGQWKNAGVGLSAFDDTDMAADPNLHFSFFQFPPALGATKPATTLGVEAWLCFAPKSGLSLVWKDVWSIHEIKTLSAKDLLCTSTVSGFVTKIEYIYWDETAQTWKEYEAPHEFAGSYTLPQFIRLTFTEGDHNITRLVEIPQAEKTMPLF